MAQKPLLRFDHREIAVLFSLFIFVALLMFTVGILVGKGLSQAKYEAALSRLEKATERAANFTEPAPHDAHAADAHGKEPAHDAHAAAGEHPKEATLTAPAEHAKAAAEEEALKLVPLDPAKQNEGKVASLREPLDLKGAADLLNNPKIRNLVEGEGPNGGVPAEVPSVDSSGKRTATAPAKSLITERLTASNAPATGPAAAAPGAAATATAPPPAASGMPASFASGAFTVQVGSYPNEKDATERVETLKKLGFPHSYFSAKQWGDSKETWYRVWLGYFPDYESAKRSGETLQKRGEVKNYLVRKNDASG